jgi:hypothetical protein
LGEVFWQETLLRYPVAIYKKKATNFRNIFFLGREGSGALLRNWSFLQRHRKGKEAKSGWLHRAFDPRTKAFGK